MINCLYEKTLPMQGGLTVIVGHGHVPECLCGGSVYLGRYNKCSTFTFTFGQSVNWFVNIWSLA